MKKNIPLNLELEKDSQVTTRERDTIVPSIVDSIGGTLIPKKGEGPDLRHGTHHPVLKGRILLIVTKWSYPFGGGEEFMYQSCEPSKAVGLIPVWVSFSDSANNNYKCSSARHDSDMDVFLIHASGGFTTENVEKYIRLFRPLMVHHQGVGRKLVADACQMMDIPFITGVHFWNEVIELDSECRNSKILEKSHVHGVHPDFKTLIERAGCYFYSVSPYVSEVVEKITGHTLEFKVEPASMSSRCRVNDEGWDPAQNEYVTVINFHEHKGGRTLYQILEKISPDIPFLLVKTEEGCPDFYLKIDKLLATRAELGARDRVIGRTQVVNIYRQTRVLLIPSLVDETYCRVANEGLMNGIPIITTGYGNLKYLVGSGGKIISEDKIDEWVKQIELLNRDASEYTKWRQLASGQYLKVNESRSIEEFYNMIGKVVARSNIYRIMILSPWCDQGLGIQSRNYRDILEQQGIEVSVFSIKPYDISNSESQRDPAEWLHPRIYYSENDRERVTDRELVDFVKKYRPGKCLIPETCWYRIFQMANLLKSYGVDCYAIPNIEIVRKDEIHKHETFLKILANNYLCLDIFKNYGLPVNYLGYGIDGVEFKPKRWPADQREPLKFLCIGGKNAFTRKQILEVCEAFVKAVAIVEKVAKANISLTVTIQKYCDDRIDKYKAYHFIKFIDYELKYSEILELYYSNHINIQVSKHEGLGIGFYESVSTGTPVITLATPPHNEIIIDNINGWIVPVHYRPMTDNNSGLFESAYFDTDHLADKIVEISETRESLPNLIDRLKSDFDQRLSYQQFINRFVQLLYV